MRDERPTRRPRGEALLILDPEDVRALIRGANDCAAVTAAGDAASPERYVDAETRLRAILQAARRRLEEALEVEPWYYLDPSAWPEDQEAPAFLRPADGRALERAARASRRRRGRDDPTRRRLSRLLLAAEAEWDLEEEASS